MRKAGHHSDAPQAGDSRHIHLLGQGMHAWTGSWRGAIALILLCLCVLLPGFTSLPPFDRDEPRFAQASRQMFASSDWVVPFVQDRPRLNKPPLIYWLQALSARTWTGNDPTRDAIWMYRLPGALCTLLSVMLTWLLGRRLLDPRAAWLGAALLAICPLVVIDAHQARADQLLLATVIASQWALWHVLRPRPERTLLGDVARVTLLGGALGVSLLAKGPIGPLVAALTTLSWIIIGCGKSASAWKQALPKALLGTLLAAAVAAAMIFPWVWAVAQRVGWESYLTLIHDETLGRAAEPKEGHAMFPGFHLVALVGLFFPGSLLAGVSVLHVIRHGLRTHQRPTTRASWWHDRPALLFLVCWLVPSWIVFEAISTRLAHYVMPLYPALALLTARVTLIASAGLLPALRERITRIGIVIWGAVGCLLTGGVPILLGVVARRSMSGDMEPAGQSLLWLGISIGIVGAALCVSATVTALQGRPLRALLLSSAGLIFSLATMLGILLPANSELWPARNVVAALRTIDPDLQRPIGALSFHEDSMIFLSDGKVQRLASNADRLPAVAAQWFTDHPNGLLVARGDDAPAIQGQSTVGRIDVRAKAGGFRINGGRWERLVVLERRESGTSERLP